MIMKRRGGERGLSQATHDLIETCLNIIEPIQSIMVRGVAYKLFVAGVIDSMSKNNCQHVSPVLCDARDLGQIPWEWIVDESRQIESQPSYANLVEYGDVVASGADVSLDGFEDSRPCLQSRPRPDAGQLVAAPRLSTRDPTQPPSTVQNSRRYSGSHQHLLRCGQARICRPTAATKDPH